MAVYLRSAKEESGVELGRFFEWVDVSIYKKDMFREVWLTLALKSKRMAK